MGLNFIFKTILVFFALTPLSVFANCFIYVHPYEQLENANSVFVGILEDKNDETLSLHFSVEHTFK